jgi:hypothetical protein
VRLEVGEGIEKKEEDFAAEVAKARIGSQRTDAAVIAYENARKTMRRILPHGRQAATQAEWLVLGAALSYARREGCAVAKPRHAPPWDRLTRAEQRGLAACWRLLGPEGAAARDIAGDYPFLLGEMTALERSLAALQSHPAEQVPGARRLRQAVSRETDDSRTASDGQGARPLQAQIAYVIDLCAALEARYGARRESLPDPRRFQLSVLEADADWLARHRDSDFWHILIPTLAELSYVTNFARQVLPTLDWILSQPDCDKATAAAAFVMLDGPRLAPLASGAAHGWEQESERQTLCHAITQRAEQGLYSHQRLLLSDLGLEDDLTAQSGSAAVPQGLFGTAFTGRQTVTPFYIEDGTLFMAMV